MSCYSVFVQDRGEFQDGEEAELFEMCEEYSPILLKCFFMVENLQELRCENILQNKVV